MDASKLLILIPFGVLALIILNQGEKKHVVENPSSGKEEYYLKFNRDETFKGLIATEGHFRNVEESGIDTKGFLNCAVKHLADVEGHLDEAISHSIITETEESSKKFRDLRNKVQNFRHDLQSGGVPPEEGIKRVRQLRREFESFNPDYDVSKCEACTVKVSITR